MCFLYLLHSQARLVAMLKTVLGLLVVAMQVVEVVLARLRVAHLLFLLLTHVALAAGKRKKNSKSFKQSKASRQSVDYDKDDDEEISPGEFERQGVARRLKQSQKQNIESSSDDEDDDEEEMPLAHLQDTGAGGEPVGGGRPGGGSPGGRADGGGPGGPAGGGGGGSSGGGGRPVGPGGPAGGGGGDGGGWGGSSGRGGGGGGHTPPPSPPPGVHGTGPRDGPIIVNAQLDLTIWAALCDITGKYPLQAWEFPIRCKGCMCSTSRRVWRCCVALVIPPASIDLDVLFSIYPYFVEDRNSPVSIRAALYYMYATEVYESVGFGNRMQFGICLVTAIRNAYPNLKSKVR